MSTHLLETKGLSISFGGIKAVQDLDFYIDKGEILALIGPNGSGKSTTVNMISGVYHQDRGQVFFEGQEIDKNMSIPKRSRLGIGRTFQTPKPFGNLTVYENIYTIALQFGSPKEADAKTREILEMTELAPYADIPASKISIEKRKWIDLARVLATDPKLVMMDEVMAGLNPSEMENSLKLVKKINEEQGITILFIEHVMKAVVSVCTRAIVLNQGRLLAEGTPQEVLNDPKVVAAYLGGDEDA